MSTWSGHDHDRQRKAGDTRADRPADEDIVTTPSQAEGDREAVEEGQGDVVHTPSQAEGDRETIERNLEQKNKQ